VVVAGDFVALSAGGTGTTLSGPVGLGGATRVITVTGSVLKVTGVISGGVGAGIVKNGLETLNLSGANTYTGTTTVNGGMLDLTRTGGGAIGGDVTINAAGVLRISQSDQIADTATVAINGGIWTFRDATPNARNETVRVLVFNGGILDLAVYATSQKIGRLALGTATYSNNQINVNAGGILMGTGTVWGTCFATAADTIVTTGGVRVAVNAGGTLAPGNPTGTLSIANGLTMTNSVAASTNLWKLAALSEFSGFSQLMVKGGTATFGGKAVVALDFNGLAPADRPTAAHLNSFWYMPRQWTIVAASGAGVITGTFSSIANPTGMGKGLFTLSGGNGTDIVLKWSGVSTQGAALVVR
jgi:autotransporter-associated beta strand protein